METFRMPEWENERMEGAVLKRVWILKYQSMLKIPFRRPGIYGIVRRLPFHYHIGLNYRIRSVLAIYFTFLAYCLTINANGTNGTDGIARKRIILMVHSMGWCKLSTSHYSFIKSSKMFGFGGDFNSWN